jgi:ABC-type uncharacterized transport system permease subunit
VLLSVQEVFTCGCFCKAIAQAFTTISLKDTFVSGIALIVALEAIALSISTSIFKLKSGAENLEFPKDFAIALRI